MPQRVLKYGLEWDAPINPLKVELQMIRHGGRFEMGGNTYGEGLFYHYREAESIAWPEDDHHRWSDLLLSTILNERITVVQGARDTGKTRGLSKFALIDYWAFPNDTLILMSSTDVRGLEL